MATTQRVAVILLISLLTSPLIPHTCAILPLWHSPQFRFTSALTVNTSSPSRWQGRCTLSPSVLTASA